VAYLKVLENPLDEMAWRRLWLMLPRIGNAAAGKMWDKIRTAANPLEAALGESVLAGASRSARPFVQRFQYELKKLRAQAEEMQEPASIVYGVLDSGYSEYLRVQYEGSASRLEDLQQLAIFAKSYRTLQDFLSELILLGELYGQEMDESDAMDSERLILSSIHQAKGLEWKVVFVLRMCEGSFPSEVAIREDSGEEEERRIFYVAATRAKDELYLTHPLMDMSGRGNASLMMQPSRFLREIRFTLYEQGEVQESYSQTLAPSRYSWE